MEGGEPDIPIYKVIECIGPTNTRVYTVAVYFRGKRLATANGHSIQQAEMKAAEAALDNSRALFPQLDYQKRVITQSIKRQKGKEFMPGDKHARTRFEKARILDEQENLPWQYRLRENASSDNDDDRRSGASSSAAEQMKSQSKSKKKHKTKRRTEKRRRSKTPNEISSAQESEVVVVGDDGDDSDDSDAIEMVEENIDVVESVPVTQNAGEIEVIANDVVESIGMDTNDAGALISGVEDIDTDISVSSIEEGEIIWQTMTEKDKLSS